MPPTAPCRSILCKLGGSLLQHVELPSRLLALFEAHSSTRLTVLTGGGEAANLVRDWAERFGLDDVISHELAIAAMDFNTELLRKLFSDWSVATCREEWDYAFNTGTNPTLLSPTPFLEAEETLAGQELPRSWDMTSDSLAAWLAGRLGCDELWLLKSCPAPSADDPGDAVDPLFRSTLPPGITVRWCNLAGPRPVSDPVIWIKS
ncbi:MAG: hypothetical protein KF777_14385 [Planctomycetaceae bacterium]|nr:hypothetical protein [Planctomycetaceae bacterium]